MEVGRARMRGLTGGGRGESGASSPFSFHASRICHARVVEGTTGASERRIHRDVQLTTERPLRHTMDKSNLTGDVQARKIETRGV